MNEHQVMQYTSTNEYECSVLLDAVKCGDYETARWLVKCDRTLLDKVSRFIDEREYRELSTFDH